MYSQLEILEAVRAKFNHVEVRCQRSGTPFTIYISNANYPFEVEIRVIEGSTLQFSSSVYTFFDEKTEVCKVEPSADLDSQLNAIKTYLTKLSNQITNLIK
jgi:hypothetical protein